MLDMRTKTDYLPFTQKFLKGGKRMFVMLLFYAYERLCKIFQLYSNNILIIKPGFMQIAVTAR